MCVTLSLKIIQHLLWRFPSQWAHREMIIFPVVIAFQLISEVLKGIKGACCIKTFIIFSVTSFNLAIMSWRKGMNQLMLCKVCLKKRRFIRAAGLDADVGGWNGSVRIRLCRHICVSNDKCIGGWFCNKWQLW